MLLRIKRLFFPKRCDFCGELSASGAHCGCPLSVASPSLCPVCQRDYYRCLCQASFQQVVAPFIYEGTVKRGILQLKNHGHPELVAFFAQQMAACARQHYPIQRFSGVTFVPANKKALRERGFNQAQRLAEEIGTELGLPHCPSALGRRESSTPQHLLGESARYRNAKDSYFLQTERTLSGTLLLVDDVCTTGATLEACSQQLLLGGAKEIYALTASSSSKTVNK